MTKKQGVLISCSVALFLIPEILWSPVTNFWYSFLMPSVHGSSQILRNNFLINSNNEGIFLMCLAVQTIGAIFTLLFFSKSGFGVWKKSFFVIVTLFILTLTAFSFFVSFSLRNGIGF